MNTKCPDTTVGLLWEGTPCSASLLNTLKPKSLCLCRLFMHTCFLASFLWSSGTSVGLHFHRAHAGKPAGIWESLSALPSELEAK